MRNEAEKDIENLCDSRVVRHFSRKDRLAYGQLLLKTAALQNHVPYLSTGLNDSKLVFKERIHDPARTEASAQTFPASHPYRYRTDCRKYTGRLQFWSDRHKFPMLSLHSQTTHRFPRRQRHPIPLRLRLPDRKLSPGIRMQKRQKWQCTQEPTNP